MEGFQSPPALGPRYLPAKITVRDSTTPPLPTPSPATSHLTPVLQNSLRSGNGKKKLLQRSTVEWVFRGRKGCGSAAKHKGPPPGCGCGTQCPQSTRPRAQGHRRAGTHSSSTRPRSPKAQSGRTLTEVGGHQPADLATAFLPPRPRAREWSRPPLPDSLLRTALTPLHPHRARPYCCYRHRGSRRLLPSCRRSRPSSPLGTAPRHVNVRAVQPTPSAHARGVAPWPAPSLRAAGLAMAPGWVSAVLSGSCRSPPRLLSPASGDGYGIPSGGARKGCLGRTP